MENKKRIYTQIKKLSVYTSVFGNLFASILKLNVAVALKNRFFRAQKLFLISLAIFFIFALMVYAGDVIVENGKIDVDGKLVVDAAGNVGIGTSSPGPEDRLYVNSGGNTRLVINAPDANQASLEFKKGGALKWQEYVTASSNDLRFFDGSRVVMTLEEGGNVGIGTTAPDSLLEVRGTGGRLIVRATDAGADEGSVELRRLGSFGWQLRPGIQGTGHYFNIYSMGSGTEMFVVRDDGNVGIGTTSPGTKLVVDEATDAFSQITIDSGFAATQYSAIDFADRGTNFWGIGKNPNNNFYIDETGVTPSRFFIEKGTGNVGIGTTSPSTLLEVRGQTPTLKIKGDSAIAQTGGVEIQAQGTAWQMRPHILGLAHYFNINQVGVGPRFVIDTNGNVGIGTTTPNGKLEISAANGVESLRIINNNDLEIHGVGDASNMNIYSDNHMTFRIDNNNNDVSLYTFLAGDGSEIMKLDESGTLTIGGGSGKLNVGTIDPAYTIDGKTYATYMSSMPGVKEEITGVMQLEFDELESNYRTVIDFDNLEEGSDLWLFSRIIDENIDNIAILLTPNAAAQTWYKKDNNERTITIYSDEASEVSYRFTAPRFDYEQWSNLHEDQELKGFVI